MHNSRSISTELWAQAHKSLIFFFSRRLGSQNAEDLAQDTLMALWAREDFEFAKEEDFLRVCYGFAKNTLNQAYRDAKNCERVELDADMEIKISSTPGLKSADAIVFLREVREIAQKMLDAEDRELLETIANRDDDDAPIAGKTRTQVHRIRKRLAKITGWKKSEV
jgi:DNA-directed RNA polymerase specialized sigma24 family protein